MKTEELVKGRRYWINSNDCCVVSSFQGKFLRFAVTDENNHVSFYDTWPEGVEEYGAEAHFDTGYVELRGATTFQEIEV